MISYIVATSRYFAYFLVGIPVLIFIVACLVVAWALGMEKRL